jgi:hypothetical protein
VLVLVLVLVLVDRSDKLLYPFREVRALHSLAGNKGRVLGILCRCNRHHNPTSEASGQQNGMWGIRTRLREDSQGDL